MRTPQLLGLLLGLLLTLVSALPAAGNKLLVVVEEESDRNKYSQFFEDLKCESARERLL